MPFAIANSGGGELRIDYAALGAIMKGPEIQSALNQKAAAMSALLQDASDGRTWIESYRTDRSVVSITVGIAGGADNAELKTGVLSEAALAVGLQVKMKGG